MLKATYQKLKKLSEEWKGYVGTDRLLKAGFTNRQIAHFVEEGYLEKVCHGSYWLLCAGCDKPEEYKALEVCLSDSNAIICAESACFYQGLIEVEPEAVSIATARNDRRMIKMNFPTIRHYYSKGTQPQDYNKVVTDFGVYNIYDVDRSVCDCIRFRKDIDEYVFDLIIDSYCEREKQQNKRLQEYAKRFHMAHEIARYIKPGGDA